MKVEVLPKNWRLKKLRQLIEFNNGKAHEDCVQENGPYVLVNSRYISTNGSVKKFALENRSPLFRGNIVMVMSDVPNGKALAKCLLIKEENKYTLNQRICVLRPISSNPEFLCYVLNRNKYYLKFDNGVGQTNLRKNEVLDCPILIPLLPEQTAIADLFSTWDEANEKIERLITAKEKRSKYLSTKHLFGAASSRDASSKRTRWFAVPEHWKIVRIGKIAKEVKSTNGSNQDIPVLSCTKYDGLVDSLAYFDKQVFSADTSKYKVVKKGLFAYATNHIEEGSIGYQSLYPKGLVSPMYTVFETNQHIDDSYLYKVLKTDIYRHIFQVNTSASVDRRDSLRWKEFSKLPIPLPPVEEQKRIASTLNTARQEIDLLKKQAEAFLKQKRGLMQKLLTGRWRVQVSR